LTIEEPSRFSVARLEFNDYDFVTEVLMEKIHHLAAIIGREGDGYVSTPSLRFQFQIIAK